MTENITYLHVRIVIKEATWAQLSLLRSKVTPTNGKMLKSLEVWFSFIVDLSVS